MKKKLTTLSRWIVSLTILSTVSCTKESNTGSGGDLPFPASNLAVTSSGPGSVKLTWTDNSTNEKGFTIERKTATSNYSVIAKVGTNTTSFEDQSVQELTGYTYRVYPYNGAGISPTYSNEGTILTFGTLVDVEGNKYTTAILGNKVWTLENLRTGKYRNGDIIPERQTKSQWSSQTTGGFCYYNNDPANNKRYGKIYNFSAAVDSRGLAPAGWHVPTDDDWYTLFNYVKSTTSSTFAGGHLKQIGTKEAGDGLWKAPNEGATNQFKFTALPGGGRNSSGDFIFNEGEYAVFGYTSGSRFGMIILLYFNKQESFQPSGFGRNEGTYLRLVKD
jgi:uncharacterized protein (TIGR02145 family)